MSEILELRQKRAALWEKTKSFLDNAKRDGDVLSAEDAAAYEKMEADIVAMGREIDILERQAEIEKQMNAATSKAVKNNPNKSETEKTGRASDEYKKAFWKAMQNKYSYEVQDALQIGTDSEGGYLVPDEFENTLIMALEEENIMRKLARTIQTSNGDRKIPVAATHGTASWIDEEGLIEDSDEAFSQITLGAYKLGTAIKISDELLNDSAFNLETYIAQEFARRIGSKEEEAFLIGDGINKPTGIFNGTGGAEIGTTAASATAITFDEIYDLFYSLKAPYRKTASWIMNDSTVKAIRKLKDENGQYLWQPSTGAGTPDTLLNRPIYTSAYAPLIETSKSPIAFGDFGYYWIAERQGRVFKRLSELYAKNGQVGFLSTERIDGKLILPETIKLLKMA